MKKFPLMKASKAFTFGAAMAAVISLGMSGHANAIEYQNPIWWTIGKQNPYTEPPTHKNTSRCKSGYTFLKQWRNRKNLCIRCPDGTTFETRDNHNTCVSCTQGGGGFSVDWHKGHLVCLKCNPGFTYGKVASGSNKGMEQCIR